MKQTPQKLTGQYRHIYEGQISILEAGLKQHGITLDQFNQAWDNINAVKAREELNFEDESSDLRRQTSLRVLAQFAAAKEKPRNVFVPTFTPQYRDMLNRGATPGHSLEDSNRKGVWVPLDWLR